MSNDAGWGEHLSIVSTVPKAMLKDVPGLMTLGADVIVGLTAPFCRYLYAHRRWLTSVSG